MTRFPHLHSHSHRVLPWASFVAFPSTDKRPKVCPFRTDAGCRMPIRLAAQLLCMTPAIALRVAFIRAAISPYDNPLSYNDRIATFRSMFFRGMMPSPVMESSRRLRRRTSGNSTPTQRIPSAQAVLVRGLCIRPVLNSRQTHATKLGWPLASLGRRPATLAIPRRPALRGR